MRYYPGKPPTPRTFAGSVAFFGELCYDITANVVFGALIFGGCAWGAVRSAESALCKE